MNNLRDWWKWHNSLDTAVEKCPEVVLHAECLADELNTWLPVYVAETRNKEGERYSPKTIYSLLTGILRHMTTENPWYPNFLDKKNPEFVDFQMQCHCLPITFSPWQLYTPQQIVLLFQVFSATDVILTFIRDQ